MCSYRLKHDQTAMRHLLPHALLGAFSMWKVVGYDLCIQNQIDITLEFATDCDYGSISGSIPGVEFGVCKVETAYDTTDLKPVVVDKLSFTEGFFTSNAFNRGPYFSGQTFTFHSAGFPTDYYEIEIRGRNANGQAVISKITWVYDKYQCGATGPLLIGNFPMGWAVVVSTALELVQIVACTSVLAHFSLCFLCSLQCFPCSLSSDGEDTSDEPSWRSCPIVGGCFPTFSPTGSPTFSPTEVPSSKPTHIPTPRPTFKPSAAPSSSPSRTPTVTPTGAPTRQRNSGDMMN